MMSLGQLFGKPSRVVLLHYHIFKNAGTTIDFVLRRNFGKVLVHLHGNTFDSVISDAELFDFLSRHPDVVAVSSHHLRPPKPSSESTTFLDILVFRHPIDRLRSMYDFYREATAGDDPLGVEAKRRTQRSFLELLVAEYPHLVSSAQVNYTANRGGKIPDEADCERACTIARQATVVGAVDQFDLAMVVAEHRLREFFPSMDFTYVLQNISRGRRKSMQQRLRAFEKACGLHLYGSLLELNAFDFRLVDTARTELRHRFEQLSAGESHLRDFKDRLSRAEMIIAASSHPEDFVRFLS